jgi:prevent-host-death family protein
MKYQGGPMAEVNLSIRQVKRDITDLVNRVASRGERIVVLSHGRPKAVLMGFEEYERLEQERVRESLKKWQAWLAESERLATAILERRRGKPLDVDTLWEAVKMDQETRDDQILGR